MWVRDWAQITVRLLHTMTLLSIVRIYSYSTALFEYLRFYRWEQPSDCQRQQRHLGRGHIPIPKCLCICWRRGTGDTAKRLEGCCCHLGPAVLLESKPKAYGPSKGSDPRRQSGSMCMSHPGPDMSFQRGVAVRPRELGALHSGSQNR